MTSVLFCTQKETKDFECKLIRDGKRDGEWSTVKRIEIIDANRHVDVDVTPRSVVASTDDYLKCDLKEGKLECAVVKKVEEIKEVKKEERRKESLLERLAREIEYARGW